MSASAASDPYLPLLWERAGGEAVSLSEGARRLLAAMGGRRVCAFHGTMGAGKTTFIKAVCRELGVRETVNSPSFAIINEYCITGTGESVYHLDFYRLIDAADARRTGCEECFESGCYCFVEWPERAAELLPPDTLHVTITAHPTAHRIVLSPPDAPSLPPDVSADARGVTIESKQ